MTSPSSPVSSLHVSDSATLERLIAHFVAAKRSLGATNHVYRANDIVDTARSLIEECAVLGAKNDFLQRGVNDEATALTAVRDGLDSVARHTNDEFKAKVEAIDLAHDRLQATLDRLKETLVDASLHQQHPPPTSSAPSVYSEQSPTSRTLHDFIDESGHQNLFESLRQDINDYNTLSNTFQDTQADLDRSLATLADALLKADGASRRSLIHPAKATSDPEPLQSVTDLFQALTTHATDMAALLQSLIENYDLCSTALKHTEGGGDAARAATEESSPLGDPSALDASLFTNKHREPITPAEKAEMLAVLENDAQEVDDVVLEIRDRLSEMEAQLDLLQTQTQQTRTHHRLLAGVLAHLHAIGAHLPAHVLAARDFSASWSDIRASLDTKGDELAALDSIYEGFLTSYSLLLTEVARRAASEAKIQKTMDEARKRVERLTEEELEMRKGFFEQVGDFLPRDIWGDLEVAPRRFKWIGVEQPGLRTVLGLDGGYDPSVEGGFAAGDDNGIDAVVNAEHDGGVETVEEGGG